MLKDVNFIELNRDSKRKIVRLDDNIRPQLLEIILQDSQFLERQGIMDYSLLICTEKVEGLYEESRNII